MDERLDSPPASLSPSEELILEWIRGGLVDAEIAVRLNVSTAEVKERIDRLLTRTGASDRAALRAPQHMEVDRPDAEPAGDPWGSPESIQPSRWRVPVHVLIGTAIAGGAIAFFLARDDRENGEDTLAEPRVYLSQDSALTTLNSVRQKELLTVVPTPVPARSAHNGRNVYDVGQMLYVEGNAEAVGAVSYADGEATVTLTGNGLLRFQNGVSSWLEDLGGRDALRFTTTFGVVQYHLYVEPGSAETSFVRGDRDTVTIFSRGEGPPVIRLSVRGYRVEVTSFGDVLIDAEPSREAP